MRPNCDRLTQMWYALVCTGLVGLMREGPLKWWLAKGVLLSMFRIMSRSFSLVVTYHNPHNKAKSDGFCVANHTTPIDCAVLACDGCYSFVSFLPQLFVIC